jgi:hypothetical protein
MNALRLRLAALKPQGLTMFTKPIMVAVALATTLEQIAYKLGHPFPYVGAEVLIAWILFDRLA